MVSKIVILQKNLPPRITRAWKRYLRSVFFYFSQQKTESSCAVLLLAGTPGSTEKSFVLRSGGGRYNSTSYVGREFLWLRPNCWIHSNIFWLFELRQWQRQRQWQPWFEASQSWQPLYSGAEELGASHTGWRTMMNPWIESLPAILLKYIYPCKFDVRNE